MRSLFVSFMKCLIGLVESGQIKKFYIAYL
jgi:hypothetical protein